MMALKRSTPYMPRLLMLKEPPWNSWGLRLLARARPASSRTSAEIWLRGFVLAFGTMGVIRPASQALNCTSALLQHANQSSSSFVKAHRKVILMQSVTCICRHCYGNVNCGNLHYLLILLVPSGIGQRHILQRQRSSLDHKVIDTGLQSECLAPLGLSAELLCCCSAHEHTL